MYQFAITMPIEIRKLIEELLKESNSIDWEEIKMHCVSQGIRPPGIIVHSEESFNYYKSIDCFDENTISGPITIESDTIKTLMLEVYGFINLSFNLALSKFSNNKFSFYLTKAGTGVFTGEVAHHIIEVSESVH